MGLCWVYKRAIWRYIGGCIGVIGGYIGGI